MQKKIQMGTYSGPDKNQARMPATFRALFAGARLGDLVFKRGKPGPGRRGQAPLTGARRQVPLRPEDERALAMWDTRESQRITGNISLGIEIFLGVIGALTLIVGGMGVANIMYAVVKQRTKEIGVKMALGPGAPGDGPLRLRRCS